jgi:hypothetical protein
MKKFVSLLFVVFYFSIALNAQKQWKDVTSAFGVNTESVKVFEWVGDYKDSAFRAYYVQVNTKDESLAINTDTTLYRRLTPMQFYDRLQNPLVVVNASFFEFKNNTNQNVIVKDGKIVAYNLNSLPGKGRDTLTYLYVLASAIGMKKAAGKKGATQLDIAYTFTDSALNKVYFQSTPMSPFRDTIAHLALSHPLLKEVKPWDVQWAVGGGPVLIRDQQIIISNEEEKKFAGKGISDKHPRTAMGYTKEGNLIIMAIQGRMKGIAVGSTLPETASLLLDLGCVEAINLDGGGSSCLLVNGKETIKPSDPTGERPVPAVLYVKQKN